MKKTEKEKEIEIEMVGLAFSVENEKWIRSNLSPA